MHASSPELVKGVEPAEQTRFARLKQAMGRAGLSIALAVTATAVTEAVQPEPAMAETVEGYPWDDAVLVNGTPPYTSNYGYDYCKQEVRDAGKCWTHTEQKNGITYYINDPYGFDYRHCTSYVAWRVDKEFGIKIPGLWGNANNWDNAARNAGYAVDVGGVEAGDIGVDEGQHVVFVESVNSDGTMYITDYNSVTYGGPGGPRKVSKSQFDHYIDVNGEGIGLNYQPVSPQQPSQTESNIFAARVGNTLYAKNKLDGKMETLAGGVASFKVAGNRLAYLGEDGILRVREGVYGSWFSIFGGPSEYDITPSLIVIRRGTALYAQRNIGERTELIAGGATDVKIAGDRITWRGEDGILYARDGVYGTTYKLIGNPSEWDVSGNLVAIRMDEALYVKEKLGEELKLIAGGVKNIKIANNRITWLGHDGILWGRDGVYGTSYRLIGGPAEWDVAPSMVTARMPDGAVYARSGFANDDWKLIAGGMNRVELAGQRISYFSNNGNVYAKDGIYGTTYAEIGGPQEFYVSSSNQPQTSW